MEGGRRETLCVCATPCSVCAIAKEPPFSPSSYLAVGVDEWLASTARADAAADTGARGQVAEEKPELL